MGLPFLGVPPPRSPTAIRHSDDGPIRPPASYEQEQLARPSDQGFVASAMLLVVAFRGRQRHEERERPDAPGPWERHEGHEANPAQATGLNEVRRAGAHEIADHEAGPPCPVQDAIVALK